MIALPRCVSFCCTSVNQLYVQPILEKKNMKEAPPKLHTCTNISLKLVIALNMRGKTVILYIVRDSEKKTIG